jgi:hypothetical protein
METFHDLMIVIVPNHGDRFVAGNVRFKNEHGKVYFDRPTAEWDQEAVAMDIIARLEFLKAVATLDRAIEAILPEREEEAVND